MPREFLSVLLLPAGPTIVAANAAMVRLAMDWLGAHPLALAGLNVAAVTAGPFALAWLFGYAFSAKRPGLETARAEYGRQPTITIEAETTRPRWAVALDMEGDAGDWSVEPWAVPGAWVPVPPRSVFVYSRECLPFALELDPRLFRDTSDDGENYALVRIRSDRDLVATSLWPARWVDDLVAAGTFTFPRQVGLLAMTDAAGGVRATVVVLAPASAVPATEDDEEDTRAPWEMAAAAVAGVPTEVVAVPLGAIERTPAERRHVGDVHAEAVDMLARQLSSRCVVTSEAETIDRLLASV